MNIGGLEFFWTNGDKRDEPERVRRIWGRNGGEKEFELSTCLFSISSAA